MELDGAKEVEARLPAVRELLRALVSEDEQPYFVGDEASIFDLSSDTEETLKARAASLMGVELTASELLLPIWKLVDLVDARRDRARDAAARAKYDRG